MSNAIKKAAVSVQTFDDLARAEAAAKARLEAISAKKEQKQKRYDEAGPDETEESLAQLKMDLDRDGIAEHKAKSDYDRAVAARAAAEAELVLSEARRRRADLEKRLEEAVSMTPAAYTRLAEQLLALVASVHQIDAEIAAYNKARPVGVDFIPTFEQRVRWSPERSNHSAIYPEPISHVFEIPALRPGDHAYRVPGTFHPTGIWIDPNGTLHDQAQGWSLGGFALTRRRGAVD
jgi:hypothetical protein